MTPPDETEWGAWSPDTLAAKLKGVSASWYIVGGWALDLWLGEQRRDHGDLEFATRPQDAELISSHLSELTFYEVKDGQFTLAELNRPVDSSVWQYWGADLATGFWRVDMMMERGSAELWSYKRHQSLKQSRVNAIRLNARGIPYLAPPNVLLFKAKHCRPKDDDDFEVIFPKLGTVDRENLRAWLTSFHPNHKWLDHFR